MSLRQGPFPAEWNPNSDTRAPWDQLTAAERKAHKHYWGHYGPRVGKSQYDQWPVGSERQCNRCYAIDPQPVCGAHSMNHYTRYRCSNPAKVWHATAPWNPGDRRNPPPNAAGEYPYCGKHDPQKKIDRERTWWAKYQADDAKQKARYEVNRLHREVVDAAIVWEQDDNEMVCDTPCEHAACILVHAVHEYNRGQRMLAQLQGETE